MRKNVFGLLTLVAVLAFFQTEMYAEDSDYEIVEYEDLEETDFESEAHIEEWTGITDEIVSNDWYAEDLIEAGTEAEDESVMFTASANEDDDDGDEDEEETEDPDKEPEEIKKVIISNINFNLQAGTKPKYTAEVTYGNAEIWYEGWSDNHGNANYSDSSGYKDNDGKFLKFTDGELYWYHLAIKVKGDDYFTGNTRFIINGAETIGKINPSMTVCSFDKILLEVSECIHQYKAIKTAPTCTQAGAEYKKCSLCGSVIDEKTIPATGHKYELDEDKSIRATCTTMGIEVYECQNEDCGDVYRKPIYNLGHHLVTEIEDPATGEEAGTYTVMCDREDCGYRQKTLSIFPYSKIVLSKLKYGYTGSNIAPSIKVTDIRGMTISPEYYTVVYYGNKHIGTATVHVTFSGLYSGKLTKTFQIVKGSQKISVNASTVTVPKKEVKKKSVKFRLGAKAKTKLTYKANSKRIFVSKKGIVKVKKGTKKGTYTITITAKGTKNWKKAIKKIKIKIK